MSSPVAPYNDPNHTFTTATGCILTLDNAGFILSRYLQAFGRNPTQFRHTVSYIITPPPSPHLLPCSPKPSLDSPTGPAFDAILTLPPDSGTVLTFTSAGPYPNKLMAKRAATWSACRSLLDRGKLDANLGPMPGGEKPKEKKAKYKVREGRSPASLARWVDEGDRPLANNSEGMRGFATDPGAVPEGVCDGLTKSQRWDVFKESIKVRLPEASPGVNGGPPGEAGYDTLTTPDVLRESVGRRPRVSLIRIEAGTERVLALLTARQLVHEPTHLELGNEGARVELRDCGPLKKLSEEQYDSACRYTERAIRSQLNKDLLLPSDGPRWLVLPLLCSFAPSGIADVDKISRGDIDWAEINTTLGSLFTPFSLGDDAALDAESSDSMASNPSELGRRFYIDSLTDLTPSSRHPSHPEKTVLEHATRKSPPVLSHPSQRIFRCSIASSGRSGGIISQPTPLSDTYLIPELYQRYCFPKSTYRALSIVPFLFTALTSRLIAAQFNSNVFENSLRPDLALMALTPPMSTPGRPEASYERLEILGDTLIKLLTTFDTCLASGPLTDERRVERHVMLSNRSLWAGGVKMGLPKYLRMTVGRVKAWSPDGWISGPVGQGKEQAMEDSGVMIPAASTAGSEQATVKIGDKIIADAVESLVGAAYLSADRSLDATIKSMKRLLIPIDRLDAMGDIVKLDDRVAGGLDVRIDHATAPKAVPETGSDRGRKGLKRDTGINDTAGQDHWMAAFTRPVAVEILRYAFRDSTKADVVFDLAMRNTDQNLKYKLIGDALIDYFIIEKLYDAVPTYSPAIITHMRHSRASDQALAAMAVCLGLCPRVKTTDHELSARSKSYEAEVRAKWKDATGILRKRGHQQTAAGSSKTETLVEGQEAMMEQVTEFWIGIVPYMSHLGALPEVLLGAILLDAHGALEPVRRVFEGHFWPFLNTFGVGPIRHSLHPKSRLQERLGSVGCVGWEIVTVHGEGGRGCTRAVKVHSQEIGRASAESQIQASRQACQDALDKMDMGKIKADCTCRSGT